MAGVTRLFRGLSWVSPLSVMMEALIDMRSAVPATGFEYWAYQRSAGGLLSICFDCPTNPTAGAQINLLNPDAGDNSSPQLLYSVYNLSWAQHNVSITNLFDPTAGEQIDSPGMYGQMSLDRFVLITTLGMCKFPGSGARC